VRKAPSDAALAAAINSPPAFDLFEYYCGQIERAADDRFALEQYDERDAWIARATEHLTALFRLCEELAPPEQLAELVSYLSWRSVYMARRDDGAYTLHPTIN
jgi:hypothetical protein